MSMTISGGVFHCFICFSPERIRLRVLYLTHQSLIKPAIALRELRLSSLNYMVDSASKIYGLFTNHPTGILSSAICTTHC